MSYAANLIAILDREPMPSGGIETSTISYEVDGVACEGFLARPGGVDDDRPGVLVVHDWLGVTDYVRMRAEMLARLGYVAFAADIYGADTRPTPADASSVAGQYYRDPPLLRRRVVGGFERLSRTSGVDRARTAAIGYCFGGATALQLARTGADLAAVVSFHGALQPGPPGEAASIRAALLVLTGDADPVVPDEALLGFKDELRGAPALDWQVVSYAGAMHAFSIPDANAPDHGAVFDPRAERRSWQAMKDFLAEIFTR